MRVVSFKSTKWFRSLHGWLLFSYAVCTIYGSYNPTDKTLCYVLVDRDESSVTGFRLLCRQVMAVWMKQWLVLIRSPWLMILQFFAPIILLNATLGVLNYVLSLAPTIHARLLMLTEG